MWKKMLLAVVLAVLSPVVVLALLSLFAFRPDNLGVRDGRLADCPASPNCVSSQAPADDAVHYVEPLRFTDTPAGAWARLVRVAADQPRTDVVTATDSYLHAEARSRLFRFTDDVEFLLDADANVIHVRSASRVGYSDLGANRRRVEAIRAAWREAD